MKTNQKGFTLIELMIVVAIIGILASVALPQYTSYIQKANGSAALQQLGAFRLDNAEYYAIEGQLRGDVPSVNRSITEDNVTVTLTVTENAAQNGVFFTCETTGVKFKNCANGADALAALTELNDAISVVANTTEGDVINDENGDPTDETYSAEDILALEAAVVAAQAAYDATQEL